MLSRVRIGFCRLRSMMGSSASWGLFFLHEASSWWLRVAVASASTSRRSLVPPGKPDDDEHGHDRVDENEDVPKLSQELSGTSDVRLIHAPIRKTIVQARSTYAAM
jgi:hypothetical protein